MAIATAGGVSFALTDEQKALLELAHELMRSDEPHETHESGDER